MVIFCLLIFLTGFNGSAMTKRLENQ